MNSSGSRLPPPTKTPPILCLLVKFLTFAELTLPPYKTCKSPFSFSDKATLSALSGVSGVPLPIANTGSYATIFTPFGMISSLF